MELSTQILMVIVGFFAVVRWFFTGHVISNHGTDKKPSKYNAYSHILLTLLMCWIVFELSQNN
jgi:hypothetical protein